MHEARAALRAGTAADHKRLDDLFGGFRLDDPRDYRAFLSAHAMALLTVEQALDAAGFADALADWPQRRRHIRIGLEQFEQRQFAVRLPHLHRVALDETV